MSVIDKIKAKAQQNVKHIVLAEGSEPRTVQAARRIVDQGIANVTLLGATTEIEQVAAQTGTGLTGIALIDPKASDKTEAYISLLVELRKAKGMTPEQARALVTGDTLYYGALMV